MFLFLINKTQNNFVVFSRLGTELVVLSRYRRNIFQMKIEWSFSKIMIRGIITYL